MRCQSDCFIVKKSEKGGKERKGYSGCQVGKRADGIDECDWGRGSVIYSEDPGISVADKKSR